MPFSVSCSSFVFCRSSLLFTSLSFAKAELPEGSMQKVPKRVRVGQTRSQAPRSLNQSEVIRAVTINIALWGDGEKHRQFLCGLVFWFRSLPCAWRRYKRVETDELVNCTAALTSQSPQLRIGNTYSLRYNNVHRTSSRLSSAAFILNLSHKERKT